MRVTLAILLVFVSACSKSKSSPPIATQCTTQACGPSGPSTPVSCLVNGAQDGDETDIDCGGGCAACVDSRRCEVASDCLSQTCVDATCTTIVTTLLADAGGPRVVRSGAHITLDGTRSRSTLGSISTWAWAQTAGPAVVLTAADTARPSFDAPTVDAAGAVLTFSLTVTDATPASASASVTVSVRPATELVETSSIGLVRQALNEGTLDRETAVRYLAFAAHGDSRLPVEFQGTTIERSGTAAMRVIAEEFATLSPESQELVRPFMLPPWAPGSWLSQKLGVGRQAAPTWQSVAGAHVVVWYLSDLASGANIAQNLVSEIESNIWPTLEGLWTTAHLPILSDGDVPAADFHGVRGKLNLGITRGLGAYGDEKPYFVPPSPAYIKLREGLPLSGKPGLIEVAAHEMTHACQDSYAQAERYQHARWIFEGVANWAEDFVYPTTNSEQADAEDVLDFPKLTLDDDTANHPYGTYLFFQYLTRSTNDPSVIPAIFQQFQTKPALAAVDAVIAGGYGFELTWRSFMAAAWNRDPSKYYWSVDGLHVGAKAEGGAAVPVTLGGAPDRAFEMDPTVRYLSSRYFHFSFADPTARSILFYDGLTYPLLELATEEGNLIAPSPTFVPDETRTRAIATVLIGKRDDTWDTRSTLPGPGAFANCQDDPADRVDELTVAFGDSKPEKNHVLRPEGMPARLWVTNIGCYRWQGTVSATTSPSWDGPADQLSGTVVWQRSPSMVQAGAFSFVPLYGSFQWSVSGDYDGCSYEGADAWTVGGINSGELVFAAEFVSGRLYRAYSGGGAAHPVSYTRTCPNDDGSTTVTNGTWDISWWAPDRQDDPQWVPKVSADGVTASDVADDGRFIYSWNFQSSAGP